jgi:hypothetical protein
MLFRDINNNLIEVKRIDFVTDKEYYDHILHKKYKITKSINSTLYIGSFMKLIK